MVLQCSIQLFTIEILKQSILANIEKFRIDVPRDRNNLFFKRSFAFVKPITIFGQISKIKSSVCMKCCISREISSTTFPEILLVKKTSIFSFYFKCK